MILFLQMLIAQTGLNPSPLLDIQPGDDGTSYSLWWLVPIAFMAVGISWYIRGQAKRNEQKTRPTRAPTTKMSESKTRQIADREVDMASQSLVPDVKSTKKTGKSKKRDRKRSEQQDKPAVSLQRNMSDAFSNGASELTPKVLTPSVSSSMAPFGSPTQQQTPVNAIFEPLREVVQQRRNSTFSAPIASSQSNEAVVSSQPSGGKFERTVAPAAAARVVANRWPTPSTQPVKTALSAASRPQALLPPSPISNPVSVPVPVQATGLKSFVTRVKSSAATNPDPST